MRGDEDLSRLSNEQLMAIIAQEGSSQSPQPQSNNLLQSAGSVARSGIAGALGAIPDTLGLAANLPSLLAGGQPPIPSFTNAIKQGIDYATNDYFTPKSATERTADNAAEFIAGGFGLKKAAATEASKIASKYFVPQVAKDYAALGTAGAGSQIAQEAAPDSAIAPLVGGTIGAFVPGGASSAARSFTNLKDNTPYYLSKALGVNPQKVEAFNQAGLSPTLGDVTDSNFIKGAQEVNRQVPLAGNVIDKAIKETHNSIANTLSPGLSQETAGEIAQSGLKGFQKEGTAKAAELQQSMAKHILPNEPISISKTLNDINSRIPFETPEVEQLFNSSPLGKEYKRIQDIAQKSGGTVPYQDINYLRQNIDDQITTFGLMGFNKEQGALKKLRGNIQGDIGEAFKAKSPEAEQDFKRFNNFYSQFAKKNESVVNDLIQNKTATQTFKSIIGDLKVDAGKANTVLQTLKPEQKQVFSQALVRELGMSPQNEFSMAYFASNFKKLEPQAQGVVLGSFEKPLQQKIRSIVDVIDNIKDTKAQGNPSGTFNQAVKGGALVGAITHSYLTGSILGGSYISARLMTSPKFINWLAKAQKITQPDELAAHVKILQRIAKTSPEIAGDVQRYLGSMQNSQPKGQEDLNTLSNDELNKIIQEEEANKTPSGTPLLSQTTPQTSSQPQPQAPQNDLINKIANIESDGNVNAKSSVSSASGLLQFTNKTWKDAVDRYGQQYGITYKDKNDPRAQKLLATDMLKDNSEDLQKTLGRAPKEAEIYLTHFLGLEGAKKLLNSNPNELAARIFPKEAKFNRGVFYDGTRPLTVAEMYNKINKKLNA